MKSSDIAFKPVLRIEEIFNDLGNSLEEGLSQESEQDNAGWRPKAEGSRSKLRDSSFITNFFTKVKKNKQKHPMISAINKAKEEVLELFKLHSFYIKISDTLNKIKELHGGLDNCGFQDFYSILRGDKTVQGSFVDRLSRPVTSQEGNVFERKKELLSLFTKLNFELKSGFAS